MEVTVEARPGEKRDWRLASVEVISESRKDSEIDPGSPEIAPKLGEDELRAHEHRHDLSLGSQSSGVTHLSIGR